MSDDKLKPCPECNLPNCTVDGECVRCVKNELDRFRTRAAIPLPVCPDCLDGAWLAGEPCPKCRRTGPDTTPSIMDKPLFSRRQKMADEAVQWCKKRDIHSGPFNVITALSVLGLFSRANTALFVKDKLCALIADTLLAFDSLLEDATEHHDFDGTNRLEQIRQDVNAGLDAIFPAN